MDDPTTLLVPYLHKEMRFGLFALTVAVCVLAVTAAARTERGFPSSVGPLIEAKLARAPEVAPLVGNYFPERVIVIGDLHGDLQQTVVALQLSEVIDKNGKWIGGATNTRLVQMGDLVDRGHQDKEVLDFIIRLKREAEADAVSRPHYYRRTNMSALLDEANAVVANTVAEFAIETGLSYVVEEQGAEAAVEVWVNRALTQQDPPVTVLLGNHEIMNLDDDMRYAAPESNIPFFVEEEEKRIRDSSEGADAAEAAIASMHSTMEGAGGGIEGAKAYYAATAAKGKGLQKDALEARRRMFKAKGAEPGHVGGRYGTFLQFEVRLIHIYNDSVFVHAGLKPQFARYGLERLNSVARTAIEAKATLHDEGDEVSLYQSPIFASDGPIWTRDLVGQAQSRRCSQIQKSLDTIGVNRMFVGHTPQRDLQIGSYCEGKFIVTDVGISRWMYGGLSTVEIISKHQSSDGPLTLEEEAAVVELRVVDPSDLSERAGREMELLDKKGGMDQFVLEELIDRKSVV